jgi:hypothetical protein
MEIAVTIEIINLYTQIHPNSKFHLSYKLMN